MTNRCPRSVVVLRVGLVGRPWCPTSECAVAAVGEGMMTSGGRIAIIGSTCGWVPGTERTVTRNHGVSGGIKLWVQFCPPSWTRCESGGLGLTGWLWAESP
jgi:hypothetical protein